MRNRHPRTIASLLAVLAAAMPLGANADDLLSLSCTLCPRCAATGIQVDFSQSRVLDAGSWYRATITAGDVQWQMERAAVKLDRITGELAIRFFDPIPPSSGRCVKVQPLSP